MNWSQLSNWNLLFVQQTSVSRANGCDIIDSSINASTVHNWDWPSVKKIHRGQRQPESRGEIPPLLVCQNDRKWTRALAVHITWPLHLWETSLRATLHKDWFTLEPGGHGVDNKNIEGICVTCWLCNSAHIVLHGVGGCMEEVDLLHAFICWTMKGCGGMLSNLVKNAWQSQLKVLMITWQQSNYQRLKGPFWQKKNLICN